MLHGESSESVFLELLTEYSVSGVSGVVPKLLTPETRALFRRGTLATGLHIDRQEKNTDARFYVSILSIYIS